MCACNQAGHDIQSEMGFAPISGVSYLLDILQSVIDRFHVGAPVQSACTTQCVPDWDNHALFRMCRFRLAYATAASVSIARPTTSSNPVTGPSLWPDRAGGRSWIIFRGHA